VCNFAAITLGLHNIFWDHIRSYYLVTELVTQLDHTIAGMAQSVQILFSGQIGLLLIFYRWVTNQSTTNKIASDLKKLVSQTYFPKRTAFETVHILHHFLTSRRKCEIDIVIDPYFCGRVKLQTYRHTVYHSAIRFSTALNRSLDSDRVGESKSSSSVHL
jgi:hypothetical protein